MCGAKSTHLVCAVSGVGVGGDLYNREEKNEEKLKKQLKQKRERKNEKKKNGKKI